MEGILRIHEFIMEKIKEKPDPNAKMAIDFDHKQPAEREKQVCLFFFVKTHLIIVSNKLYHISMGFEILIHAFFDSNSHLLSFIYTLK